MLSTFAVALPSIGGRLCNAVALSGAERAITALSGHLANAARAPSMVSEVIGGRLCDAIALSGGERALARSSRRRHLLATACATLLRCLAANVLSMFVAAPPFIGGRLCNFVAVSDADRD